MQKIELDSSDGYIATPELLMAVKAAITLQRPLLLKGEPGTGKTMLAQMVAKKLGKELIVWPVKSTTKAQHGLYEYDAVSRLRDSQLGDAKVHDIRNYLMKGKLWQAFESQGAPVLLIDEIDKADIEFPNDLLRELDQMEFHVHETGEIIRAKERPIIIITSNNEKELPDAFLRRCFFHFISFPDVNTLRLIVNAHYPGLHEQLMASALNQFLQIRDMPDLKKKPSTSELLDWIKLLIADGNAAAEHATEQFPPHAGALIKSEQDMSALKRLFRMLAQR